MEKSTFIFTYFLYNFWLLRHDWLLSIMAKLCFQSISSASLSGINMWVILSPSLSVVWKPSNASSLKEDSMLSRHCLTSVRVIDLTRRYARQQMKPVRKEIASVFHIKVNVTSISCWWSFSSHFSPHGGYKMKATWQNHKPCNKNNVKLLRSWLQEQGNNNTEFP